jgi:hypothetical protein
MKWETLISTHNLKLAWRRINTARNLQYKRFYREAYRVYEGAIDEHIRNLHKTLKAKAWEPQFASRLYLPKPSGLQRPLSLLDIEDQILLQAIANMFAKKLFEKRQKVELNSVFSNSLAKPKGSIFFTQRWQTSYQEFQKKCTDFFNVGYRWAADFDLAAYYDTISHDLLLSIETPRGNHSESREVIQQWLQTWSAGDLSAMTGHGIPQGPIASDFLAEAFFLPIDLRLQNESFGYIRYVDDIRLFGKTENDVLKAAILLEQECRHRGLIPQSAKFDLHELKSPQDAMGSLPSISPSENRSVTEPTMTAKEAHRILLTAIDGKPLKITDKSRFRYVLYRAPADTRILNTVLLLLPRHPEHIDAFTAYFANFGNRPRIARAALNYLANGLPYSYVRGELWHVVARLAGTAELRQGLSIAKEDARKRSGCIALSWGVMHFLIKCHGEGIARLGRRLSAENPISRALLAPAFGEHEFTKNGNGGILLKGTLIEQLAGSREMQKRGITLNSMGLRQRDLSPTCKNALISLGVIKRRHLGPERDWIAERLVSLYECEDRRIWHKLLGSEYEHAQQIIVEAYAHFSGAYSEWLALQDSFNDLVIRKLFDFFKRNGISGYSKTLDKNGNLVKFGILISKNQPFSDNYPNIAPHFRLLHERRNKLPGSHPYDEKGGNQNKWLSKRERNALVSALKEGLNEIGSLVIQDQYQ